MGIHKKIGLGTLTGSMATVISIISSIVAVPLFIRTVGAEQYGIFILITTVLGFVGLTDLGITSAVTNEISYLFADQKKKEISELLSGSMIVLGGFLVVIFFLLFFIASTGATNIPSLLGVDGAYVGIANSIFIILLFFTCINLLFGGIFTSFFRGINEIAAYNVIQSLYQILFSLSFILFLFIKPTLVSVAWFHGISFIFRLAIFYFFTKKYFPWLEFKVHFFLIKKIKPLISHSVTFFYLAFLNSLIGKTDYLLLSHTVGVQSIPAYSIADRLYKLPSIAIQVGASAGPSIAQFFQQKRLDSLASLYSQVLRTHLIFRAVPLLFLLVFSQEIIRLWVGQEFFYGYIFTSMFFISYMIYSWTGPHFDFINAMSKHKSEIIPLTLNVLINIGSSIYFAKIYGPIGVIMGTIVANLLCTSFYLPYFLKKQIPIHPLKELLHIVSSFLPSVVLLFTFHYIIITYIFSISWQLASTSVLLVAYLSSVYVFVLQKKERIFAKKMIKIIFGYVYKYNSQKI